MEGLFRRARLFLLKKIDREKGSLDEVYFAVLKLVQERPRGRAVSSTSQDGLLSTATLKAMVGTQLQRIEN